MAGPAAEQQALAYTKDQAAELMTTVWGKDVETPSDTSPVRASASPEEWRRQLGFNNFDAVEMVAKALEERGSLDGDEIAALFE